jgi:septum formation protein
MLKEKLSAYNLILASGSPRRQQFLKDLDLAFEIRLKDVEEVYPPELKGAEITEYLCELKSSVFLDELTAKDILITSDTIVWFNDAALGKPRDRQDAFNMLRSLSGHTHEVITSVCFRTVSHADMITDITQVSFKELSDEQINYYLDNYTPYDKAGSYGIQEWLGYVGVSGIEGSYANVMGLPVDRVFDYLNNFV